ncbi:GNAT family N-acetyltransferase [Microbulbifer hydrolyticus]|nr:GNAT family N-acetyltransferase [Microbulbifer hydrolyticus]
MQLQAKLLSSPHELPAVAAVLLQLRPKYTLESLLAQIEKQQVQGYQLAYVREGEGNQVLCVAGFVISEKLAWGKHIYVDDLVTDSAHRSAGAGRVLIDWLKQHGKSLGCDQLHLDSGVQRFAAHRFYLREGFDITSHHFALGEL